MRPNVFPVTWARKKEAQESGEYIIMEITNTLCGLIIKWLTTDDRGPRKVVLVSATMLGCI